MASVASELRLPTLRLPTRTEVRIMWQRPAVLVTALLCATFVVSLFVVALALLAYSGHSTEALTAAVVIPIVSLLVNVSRRLSNIERTVNDAGSAASPDRT